MLPARFEALFLTASSGELIVLLGRALTAGVCEETMFRGFALTYLNRLFGRMWPGVLLATLAFSYGHLYTGQGLAGFGATVVIALVLVGLFLWRKSLWPAIFLHCFIDAFQLLVVLPSR